MMNKKEEANTIKKQNKELVPHKNKVARITQQVRVSVSLHSLLRYSANRNKTTMSKALDHILSSVLVHGQKELDTHCKSCGFVNKLKLHFSDFSIDKKEQKELRKEKSEYSLKYGYLGKKIGEQGEISSKKPKGIFSNSITSKSTSVDLQ